MLSFDKFQDPRSFDLFASAELEKCRRLKAIWQRSRNSRTGARAFFAWCVKRFQLQQIHRLAPGNIGPHNRFSMDQVVGYL